MPIYEFECSEGHRFEKILPLSMADEEYLPCLECAADDYVILAQRVASITANPQIAPPTIIYRNKETGKTEVAIIRNQANPYGMEKIELRGPIERAKFEKEMQEKHNIENAIVTERNFTIKNESRKNRQADTRARLNDLAYSSENPEFTKDLMKLAMERDAKKELPHKKTEFHLAINHQDQSNLNKE